MTLFVFQYFATKNFATQRPQTLQPKPCKKRCNPPTYQKQYNANGEHRVPPSHPDPPPPITKVLAPESRQKVGSPYHYDHPKEFPALSSGFGCFESVCVFVGSCWKGPGFFLFKQKHTRGATSQEKTMKEGG